MQAAVREPLTGFPHCWYTGSMSDKKELVALPPGQYKLSEIAYIRDDSIVRTGEEIIIASLLHTKGHGRDSKDMDDLRKIMRDRNLD